MVFARALKPHASSHPSKGLSAKGRSVCVSASSISAGGATNCAASQRRSKLGNRMSLAATLKYIALKTPNCGNVIALRGGRGKPGAIAPGWRYVALQCRTCCKSTRYIPRWRPRRLRLRGVYRGGCAQRPKLPRIGDARKRRRRPPTTPLPPPSHPTHPISTIAHLAPLA